tara:strand:- start:1774 stop:3780 length:2007 start_codon:yes stop_codon:yes gene_type:complete
MFNFNHLTLNTFGETEVYNVNLSSFSSDLYPHHQLNGNHVRLSSFVDDIQTTPSYRTRIYYDDVLIFDTGSSEAVDVYGNPLNWPPKATYSNGSTTRLQLDYPSDTANGRTFKVAFKFHDIGEGNQEFSQPRHYLIPDVEYDVIKNGTTFPGSNTTIENTLPAGSHFLLGDYQTSTSLTNNSDFPGEVERNYYFSLIRLNNPPPIYRNSLALEDSTDNDFNDLIVTVTSGSGFFTGDVTENTVTFNGSTNINVGNQVSFTTTGTFTWTVPDGVTSVSAVCVGAGGGAGGSGSCDTALSGWAGGGGGGGGLSYGTFDVTPGETLTIIVGAGGAGGAAAGGQQTIICPTVGSDGGDSEIKRNSTSLLKAGGGGGGQMGGSTNGIQQNNTGGSSGTGNQGTEADGGGNGGVGGRSSVNFAGGAGGGAAGYSGNGGRGRDGNSNSIQTGTSDGSGGGGSGGTCNGSNCGGGGGVGVDNGEGSSGSTPGSGQGGNGGSGGGNGSVGDNVSTGGNYGGGGGSDDDDPPTPGGPGRIGGAGANGVVRIIWGNVNNTQRQYPSTNVSDNSDSGNWGKFTDNSFIANETGQFNFTTFRHAGNRSSFLLYKNSNDYILLKASSTNSTGASTTVAGVLTKGTYEVYARKNNNFSSGMHAQVQSIDVDKYPSRAFYNPNP